MKKKEKKILSAERTAGLLVRRDEDLNTRLFVSTSTEQFNGENTNITDLSWSQMRYQLKKIGRIDSVFLTFGCFLSAFQVSSIQSQCEKSQAFLLIWEAAKLHQVFMASLCFMFENF